ncbi:MAG TPA: hypothetical protein VF713_16610 [Thermoanaerobaculia bacterium]
MKTLTIALTLALSLTTLSAQNVTTTPVFVVPGVAKVAGFSGSFFHTSIWMTNPNDSPIVVRLRYIPGAGFTRAGAVDTEPITIGPHTMMTFDDLLTDTFHATANTGGVAIVEAADAAAIPLVTARTFNDTPGGTFGQFIEAMPIPSTPTGETWIDGLAGDSASRTNVGIVNFGASDLTATLSLFNPAGVKIGNDVQATAPPHSSIQIGAIQTAAGLGNVPAFSVRATSSGVYALYASKLDNVTSDPIFITSLPARTTQWIDGVGSLPGAGGTFFRSSLSLANHQSTTAHVRVAFLISGQTTPPQSVDIVLGSGESRFYGNVIGDLFNASNAEGTLVLVSDNPVTAWTRTYNDRGALGTLGQFIPSFGSDDLIGANGVILQGLSENESFRTNAGFVNVGNQDAVVIALAWSSTQLLPALNLYLVRPGQPLFIGSILEDLGVAPQTNAYLQLATTPSDLVYAWASYVDNKSTDQTFIRPIRIGGPQ